MESSEVIHPEHRKSQLAAGGSIPVASIQRAIVSNDGLQFAFERASAAVWALRDDIIRVKVRPGADVLNLDSIVPLARELKPLALTVRQYPNRFEFETGKMAISIRTEDFGLEIRTLAGNVICMDSPYSCGISDNGKITCSKTRADAPVYGLGEKTGFLDKRGTEHTMWNSDVYAPHVPEITALYDSIPVFYARGDSEWYGVFINNPGRTGFSLRDEREVSFWTETGDLDYYLFVSDTLAGLVERYTFLSGRAPLPPKFALGYHQSRYSYQTAAEVLSVAREFRARHIPCDALHLDIHHMDEYRVFTWHKERFLNPDKMMSELSSFGFHAIPIVDPGVKMDYGYPVYQSGAEGDHFCRHPDGRVYSGPVWPGESTFPDFTRQSVREWWGALHEAHTRLGIDGIWNDMNEPAVFTDTKTMDLAVLHQNDGHPLSHRELHNAYGHYMAESTYHGMKRLLQGKRPFVLTRAGYAGTQRFAAVWTGDNRSFWEHLAMSIPMLLNMGLSGLPFAGADVGGFAFDADGLLLTRWTQLGAFTPFFRNHSAMESVRQEPWSFGPVYEAAVTAAIEERYRLLPHLYSLFYVHGETGLPLMRPLALAAPNDPVAAANCDSFLLGEHLLVAPLYRPDSNVRSVYLPAGVWHDRLTGAILPGGRHVLKSASLSEIPTFMRAGGILPLQSVVQHTGEPPAELTLHVYAGGSGDYTLYDDDGTTYACESGHRLIVKLVWTEDLHGAHFAAIGVERGYKPERLPAVTLTVHGSVPAARPFDAETGAVLPHHQEGEVLLVPLPEFYEKDVAIAIYG